MVEWNFFIVIFLCGCGHLKLFFKGHLKFEMEDDIVPCLVSKQTGFIIIISLKIKN